MKKAALAALVLFLCPTLSGASRSLRVLIVDGQNNHQWQITTPVLKRILENSGRFQADVWTSPASGQDMDAFQPRFRNYDVVVSNYNGEDWPEEARRDFQNFVEEGGGFVCFHAADNAFPTWSEYNRMIGLGGWGDRTEAHGPYLRWREGAAVRVVEPGRAGSHGRRHQYVVDNRAPEHPIMKGLPQRWLHSTDELYDRLRGPAEKLKVLATAFSDPETGGSGEHEPVLFTILFGEGRIFHTVLGDNLEPLFNVGFQVTLVRGAEWAATGTVTTPVPSTFPSAQEIVSRDPYTPYWQDALGWKPLFNGKDLTGWKQVNGSATYEVVQDRGEIVGTTAKGSPNSFLATVEEYGDFELRFEVKLDNGELNSGVQIRSHQYEVETETAVGGNRSLQPKGRVYGYQVEIEASRDGQFPGEDYGDAGFVYDEARRGWLSGELARNQPEKRAAFRNGDWNQYQIQFRGSRLQTWVNGVLIADLEDSETSRGHIMLQVHSIPEDAGPWSVRWRNIFLRELKDTGESSR